MAHTILFGGRLAIVPKLVAGIGGSGIGVRGEDLSLEMLTYLSARAPRSQLSRYAYLRGSDALSKCGSNKMHELTLPLAADPVVLFRSRMYAAYNIKADLPIEQRDLVLVVEQKRVSIGGLAKAVSAVGEIVYGAR